MGWHNELSIVAWVYDVHVVPGWADYLALALTIAGFITAFVQLRKTKDATETATKALAAAQRKLAHQSVTAMVPQFQSVIYDLSHTMTANDSGTTQRILMRFGLLARETAGVVFSMGDEHKPLYERLTKAAEKATKVKGTLAGASAPDVPKSVKVILNEIEGIVQDLTEFGSTVRITIEGA